MAEKNMAKYERYRKMFEDLNRAMRAGFYYEAIFLEYAIIEDRTSSLLRHAGHPTTDKNGDSLKLHKKPGNLKAKTPFTDRAIRRRLPLALPEALDNWRDGRNGLIHDLANTPYEDAQVRGVAEQGAELCKTLRNKVRAVNDLLTKNGEAGEAAETQWPHPQGG